MAIGDRQVVKQEDGSRVKVTGKVEHGDHGGGLVMGQSGRAAAGDDSKPSTQVQHQSGYKKKDNRKAVE